MAEYQYYGKRPTWRAMLLQHVIVFLICVVFPGATTCMAPASWVNFTRGEDGVRCKTWTCMFFVVPFKIQQVEQVIEISQREKTGRIERQREFGRTTSKNVHVDGEGFLQVKGVDEKFIEVSVSPASLENVIAKANSFLNSPSERTTTMFAIANWKFGGLMGGILSIFTLLYVVGYTLGSLKFLLTSLKRAANRPSS